MLRGEVGHADTGLVDGMQNASGDHQNRHAAGAAPAEGSARRDVEPRPLLHGGVCVCGHQVCQRILSAQVQ